jgi:putative transposase
MRQPRIKVSPHEAAAVYHCVTKTVNGEWLFDDVAKEVLRLQMWQVADYCGVQVLTYVILSNHFHVLVRVPEHRIIDDAELLRRYAILYPRSTAYQQARLEVVKSELNCDGPEAIAWRKRQLALMGDISQYMKLLKQRFSIWLNKSHGRFGTLWAERFKSVLVEGRTNILQTMAAYIDLNAVRAGIITEPLEYRFCGYAEAVAGNRTAQLGIQSVMGTDDWDMAQAQYRQVLFGTGEPARVNAASFPAQSLQFVIQQGGKLSRAEVLRCRLRYFTDGAVLGTRAFVTLHMAKHRKPIIEYNARRTLPACAEWGEMMTLRCLRFKQAQV